jgi:predicted DNA-binding protein
MSITDNDPNRAGVKTLAIRLDPELHAQLSLVAQLRGKTITDEIRTAIEAHIESVKTAPELVGKAETVLEEIERDAHARRAAIATLFGTHNPPATTPDKSDTPSSTRTRRKPGAGE